MTILPIDTQTQTATYVGSGTSISSITGAWTLKLQIGNLTTTDGSTPTVRFEFDDTVNSFTASLAGPTYSIKGSRTVNSDDVHSWKQQDFPDLRFGTASAQLRLQLSNITANTSCTYHAWVEY